MLKAITILGIFCGMLLELRAGALDTWTNISIPGASSTRLIYGNGRFITFGVDSGLSTRILISTNGLNWTTSEVYGAVFTGLAFGNGFFAATTENFALDGGAGQIFISTDGMNWTNFANAPAISGAKEITFGNGNFIAVGNLSNGTNRAVAYVGAATNLSRATPHTILSNLFPTSVAAGNGLYLTLGGPLDFSAQYLCISTNGNDWQSINPSEVVGNYASIRFFDGLFYLTSTWQTNGTTQTNYYQQANPLDAPFVQTNGPIPQVKIRLADNSQMYLAPGAAGTIFSSTNLSTWLPIATGFTNDLLSLVYNGHRLVSPGSAGVSAEGIFFTSGDTAPSLQVSKQINGVQIKIAGGLGPIYRLQASSDLVSWSDVASYTQIGKATNFIDSSSNSPTRFYRTVSP